MSTKTYNTLEGQLSVSATATATRAGTSDAVAIVGGYDEQNASSEVTAGEATKVTDPTSADTQFGISELSRASAAVAGNGVTDIYGVPVSETETTESVSGAQTFSLSEAPLFNPDLHPDHSITVTDTQEATDCTVEISYAETLATPSEENTVVINPLSGDAEADATSDYEVTYTYGTYDTAIQTAADLPVRYVIVLQEDASVKATLTAELAAVAADLDFKRGVMGATPEIGSTDISDYTPNQRDWRLVEVAPALGTGADGPVRTAAAIGGFMASQPIGPDGSTLYDNVSGLTGLNTPYRSSEVRSFDGVTAITRNGVVGQAVTTSDVEQFQNVYATEIIDDVALDLFGTARSYAGGPQDITDLETLLEVVCQSNARGSPPNLGFPDGRDQRPYDVSVTLGADTSVANGAVSIVPYPIAEEVNINLTVSDGYVQFGGVN